MPNTRVMPCRSEGGCVCLCVFCVVAPFQSEIIQGCEDPRQWLYFRQKGVKKSPFSGQNRGAGIYLI